LVYATPTVAFLGLIRKPEHPRHLVRMGLT
jgi:hypothetical protein